MRSVAPYNSILSGLRNCNRAIRCFIAAAMLCTQTIPLMANPIDGVVSAGSADINQAGNTVTVTQQTDKAVIDWRGFDIAKDETTQFIQPSSSSLTLNRVNSNSPSFIDGALKANGNLVVVNPNGVWFGSNARVDVNSLIASTADITNDTFMNNTGILDFDIAGNPNAAVINDGLITAKEAGLVGLVAPNVINRGVILAKLGRVALASGDTATVDLYGDGLVKVAVSDQVQSQLVANSGIIAAEGGAIALTAAAGKNIVNSLITVSGELSAPSVHEHNGKIIIAAEGAHKTSKQGASRILVSGILDASGRNAGEHGGSILVTADDVALLNGTRIDASGSDGLSGTTFGKLVSAIRQGSAGGDIRIGGDYLGQGDTPTALNLYVDSGALILNDAINSGDAGRTIFWSDGTTQFYGNVYARALGGNGVDAQTWNAITSATSNTGDGGFVETSGHNHLDVGGYVDLTASNGDRGTYFLDPTNITIYGNFAPTNISGLQIWVDASNAGSITQTGGVVTAVNSLVNGYTASIYGAGTVVTGASTQNGLNVFSMNGTAALQFSGINLGANLTAFGLVQSNTATWNNYGFIASARGANGFIIHPTSASKDVINYNYDGSGAFNAIGTETLSSITNYAIYELGLSASESFYGANSAVTISGGQSRSATPIARNIVIGSDDCCGNRILDGKYAEFFLYNTYLSANDRVLLAQYQSAKWGTSLTPPGSGVTEAAQATASIQKGDAADGYSVFTTRYLERLSQSANISLQASNNITLDFQGDTMNFATAGRSLTLTAGNQITTASTGTITTNGGAISMYANDSIAFNNAFTLNSNGGAILLNADRDASGAGAINLTSTTINSGGGNITMGGGSGSITAGTGYAVGTSTYENGIFFSGGSVNAAGGNIIANGKSAVTTTSFISGVNLDSAANVNTTGSGTISLYGLGNTGTGTSNRGVRIVNGAVVTGQNGNITLNGTGGGSGTAANNYGIFITGSSYVRTSGSGNINATGVGGNSGGTGGVNYGVFISAAGSYIKTLGTGNITITGTKGGQASSYGFLTDTANAVVTSGTAGNITVLSDTFSISGAGAGYNISSVGTLTIAPLTAITMGIGTSAGGSLNLSDTNLANLSAVSFVFGSASTGNVTVNTAKNFATSNVSFISGGTLSLTNTLTTTNAAIGLTATGGILVGSAATLTSGGGAINVNSAVTLSAALTFNDGGSNNTITPVISGTGSLVKQGSGTLTLAGANTYSGGTTISAGAITIGDVDGLGSGGSSVSIATGTTLNINITVGNNLSYSHIWSGAGAISFANASGTGNYIAGTGTAYTGTITTSGAGKPSFSSIDFSNASLVANASITIINGATTVSFGSLSGSGLIRQGGNPGVGTFIVGNLGTSTTYSGTMVDGPTGALVFQKTGTGTLTLTGANTYTGTTTISAGTLQIGNGSTTGTIGTGAVTNNSALIFNRSDAVSVANVISGTGSLTKSGAGTTTLTGANTYTGATNVNAGTLQAGSTTSFGSNSAVTIATGATLDLAGVNTTIGSLAGTGGTVTNSNATAVTLTTGGNNTTTSFAGIIQNGSGTTAITKTGSGTQTLSGANTYTGLTTVSAGTLSINNTGGTSTNANISGQQALTTSGISVSTGAVAVLNLGTNFSSTNAGMTLSGAGTIRLNSASVWWLGGASAGTTISMSSGGLIDVQAGTLKNDYGNVAWSANQGDLNLASGTTLDLRTSGPSNNNVFIGGLTGTGTVDNLYGTTNTITVGVGNVSSTFNGLIKSTTGITNFIKTGSGTLTLSGTNTYSGTTTINGGTLKAGSNTAFSGNSALTLTTGTTLDIAGFSNSIGSLAGTAGTVTNSSVTTAALTAGANNSSTSFGGVIQSGAGVTGFAKAGTGTLTLSGANTYTGVTSINAGIVNLSGSLTATSGLTIATGATLNYTGTAAYNKICYSCGAWTINGTLNNTLTTGTVAQTLPSVVNLNNGTITGSGVTADSWGDFAISQSTTINATGSSTIGGILRGNTPLTLNTATLSDSVQVSGVLANQTTLSLVKNGLGTATLSGANTYTGNTTVNAGTLTLSGSLNVGAATETVSVASGATLNGTGVLTANALTVSGLGTVSLTGNNAVGTLSGSGTIGDLTFKNAISLALDTITANTLTVQTTSATADITIGATKVITATGTGTALTLASGRNFINNAGSSALSTPSGRWLVYSANPSNDTVGGLNNSFRRFSCTYGGSCPSIPGTGNGLLYTTTPTLTITAAATSIVYGAVAPNLSGYAYTASGYLGSDSAADVLTGSLTGSSSYVQGSNVGTYNINYVLGTLSSAMGYALSYANNASAISVTPRAITIAADAKTKVFGATDPILTYQLTSGSFYGTDRLSGALSRIAGENVGTYGIRQNTLSAGSNYTISYIANNLSITRDTSEVTATPISKGIPVTVTRVSQDPTLVMSSPTGGGTTAMVVSSRTSVQSTTNTSANSSGNDNNNPTIDQTAFMPIDFDGAWLKISPALAAILHSSTEFQP